MFIIRRTRRMALGFVLGCAVTMAAVGAAASAYPPTRSLGEKLYRKYRRRLARLDFMP